MATDLFFFLKKTSFIKNRLPKSGCQKRPWHYSAWETGGALSFLPSCQLLYPVRSQVPKFGVGSGLTSALCNSCSSTESRDSMNDKFSCPCGNVFSSQVRAVLCCRANQDEAPSSSKSSRTACRLILIWTSTAF